MGRSRSRSRSRGRRRSRSRDRRRSQGGGGGGFDDRHRFLVTDPEAAAASMAAQMQQQQMLALQQQELQKQLLAQQMMMGPGGLAAAAAVPGATQAQQLETVHRKQREIYIGNLAMGIITQDLLREFWDQVFAHTVPDPVADPPVVNVNMDGQGRFAFVEFQTHELATKALEMDHVVEICGRAMHIGRPKGYIEPGPGEVVPSASRLQREQAAAPQPLLAGAGGQPATAILLLSNLLPAGQLRGEEERRELQGEVHEEASKYGAVEGVYVAAPPAHVQDLMPGRAYVKYGSTKDATTGKAVFDGHTLDGNTVKAVFVTEEEYARAASGEWVVRQSGVAGVPLPGLYNMTPLVSGLNGLTAFNPALASLVTNNPGLAAMLTASIEEDEVPYEEGWVKLRGFPPAFAKAQLVEFVKPCAPELTDDDVKVVLSADGTGLGEAFVHLRGPRAKLRLALAKDRSVMPGAMTPVEVITAMADDLQRRLLSGCMLV